MKFLLLLLCGMGVLLSSSAQYVYTIKADSTKLTGTTCDSSELILQNHTQAVPGFLFNTGNGRTIFKRALQKISTSSYLLGADTLNIFSSTFDTVANLASLEGYTRNPNITTIVVTDTARGGVFTLQFGTFTADSGTVFKAFTFGTNNYYWIRSFDISKGLNALWFGVKRDGTTDNTAPLTQAIAVAARLRTPLYLPNGIYMTGQQTMPSFVTLRGTNRDSCIIKLKAGAAVNGAALLLHNQKCLTVEDLTIDGNAANQTNNAQCVYVQCDVVSPPTTFIPTNLLFRNVKFYNCAGIGLNLSAGPLSISDVHVEDCYFDSTGRSALELIGANNVWVNDNHFTRYAFLNTSVTPCISINNQADTNINVIGNYVKNTTNTEYFFETVASATGTLYGATIRDNVIDGNYKGGAGISMSSLNSKITGNIIRNGGGGQRGGLELTGSNLIVSGNVITDGEVVLTSVPPGFESIPFYLGYNNIISGNSIRDSALNGPGLAVASSTGSPDSITLRQVIANDNTIDVSGSIGNAPGIVIGAYGSGGRTSMISIHHNRIIGNSGAPCIRISDSTVHDVKFDGNTYVRGYAGLELDSPNLYNIQVINENFDSVGGLPIWYVKAAALYNNKVFLHTPIKDTLTISMVQRISNVPLGASTDSVLVHHTSDGSVGEIPASVFSVPPSGIPTVSAGSAAGTGSSVSISAASSGFMIVTITTGTSPATGALFTVNFPSAWASSPVPVWSWSTQGSAIIPSTWSLGMKTNSTTQIEMDVANSALTASTKYAFAIRVGY